MIGFSIFSIYLNVSSQLTTSFILSHPIKKQDKRFEPIIGFFFFLSQDLNDRSETEGIVRRLEIEQYSNTGKEHEIPPNLTTHPTFTYQYENTLSTVKGFENVRYYFKGYYKMSNKDFELSISYSTKRTVGRRLRVLKIVTPCY